ncbi:hypothetical protein VN0847_13870 [Helicobacter pylori]
MFVAQLLCDGGINKYGLSCAGLTENLLKDIYNNFGLASASEVDEELAKLEKEGEVEYPPHPYGVALFFSLLFSFSPQFVHLTWKGFNLKTLSLRVISHLKGVFL